MKLEKSQGPTIGEASRMLGISLSMVERLFEQRVLTGWKHPISGMIVIDRGSVNAFKRNGNTTK